MSLGDDLTNEVTDIFKRRWTTTNGTTVPESENVALGNEAVKIDGVVLYADLDESTALVERYPDYFAAEVYKSFLRCAARIIRSESGTITAYDGDRIMAVFIGGSKNTCAARAALKINYANIYIIRPALKAQYPSADFVLRHTVGVDSGELFVARAGIRGANDLVWIGRAANHAAKLTALSAAYPSYITKEVYDNLDATVKTTNGQAMWEAATWTTTGRAVYRSTWWWRI